MNEVKSTKTGAYIDVVPDGYKLVNQGKIKEGDLIFTLGSSLYGTNRGWRKARKEDIGGTLEHLHGVCRIK